MQVVEAVRSVLLQSCPVLEVIVVVDGPDARTVAELAALRDPRVRLVIHPCPAGPGAARNTGVRAAHGDWVAFLDDDDLWLPAKIERQWALVESLADASSTVVACGVRWQTEKGVAVWPTRAPREGEPVGEYLFVRDHAGEGLLPTPTLLLTRKRAEACPFPEDVSNHEDHAWVLDLQAHGARFAVVLEPLVLVDAAANRDSLSRRADWQASLSWALSHRAALGSRAFSGFCLTEVARGITEHRLRAGASVLATALSGSPRSKDVVRFLAIVGLPEGTRWWMRSLFPQKRSTR